MLQSPILILAELVCVLFPCLFLSIYVWDVAVDYASVVAFELWQSTQGQYNVTMKFKNGTNDDQFRQLKMWGHESHSLDELRHDLLVRS